MTTKKSWDDFSRRPMSAMTDDERNYVTIEIETVASDIIRRYAGKPLDWFRQLAREIALEAMRRTEAEKSKQPTGDVFDNE
jgi:hypothetical protein